MAQTCKLNPLSPKQASRRKSAFDRAFDVEFCRALGDPARARLLSCLLKCARPCGVSEVAACCSLDLSTVSRHLAKLAGAGLVESEKSGREVRYRADAEALAGAFRTIADAIDDGATCPDEGRCSSRGVRTTN